MDIVLTISARETLQLLRFNFLSNLQRHACLS